MLEIYNESIKDLLAPTKASSRPPSLGPSSSSEWNGNPASNPNPKQYTVKHDAAGNTTVADLSLVEVATWQEVSSLIARAAACR